MESEKRGPWKYQPHDGSGIQSPLKAGANWKFEGDDVNAGNGNIWKRTGRTKVVGHETITTKAGTFETFKIETTVSETTDQRSDPKMEITQQTWYAPSIDHWVKRTIVSRGNGNLIANNTIELVEYGRKNRTSIANRSRPGPPRGEGASQSPPSRAST